MFQKEDLKNGMVVKLRNKSKRLFWEGRFIDEHGFIPLNQYNQYLENIDRLDDSDDIDKIYLTHNVGYLEDFFSDFNLTEIWSRY